MLVHVRVPSLTRRLAEDPCYPNRLSLWSRKFTVLIAFLAAGAQAYSPVLAPRAAPRVIAHRRAVACAPATACPAVVRAPAPLALADVVTETPLRSAVKAVGWRLTAGIVTAITSMIFTKSLATAAAIVGWDLCSKSVTMFIGERLWNKVEWGKDKGADSSQRSLAKALAWRVFAAFNTLVGSMVLTKGKAGVAGKIAGTDSVVKTILFYFYERLWAQIGWGKETGGDDAVTVDAEAA